MSEYKTRNCSIDIKRKKRRRMKRRRRRRRKRRKRKRRNRCNAGCDMLIINSMTDRKEKKKKWKTRETEHKIYNESFL